MKARQTLSILNVQNSYKSNGFQKEEKNISNLNIYSPANTLHLGIKDLVDNSRQVKQLKKLQDMANRYTLQLKSVNMPVLQFGGSQSKVTTRTLSTKEANDYKNKQADEELMRNYFRGQQDVEHAMIERIKNANGITFEQARIMYQNTKNRDNALFAAQDAARRPAMVNFQQELAARIRRMEAENEAKEKEKQKQIKSQRENELRRSYRL